MHTDEEMLNGESENRKANEYRHYYFKAAKWFIGNIIFGLAPLLLIWVVYALSNGASGNDEMSHLIHDGVVLFVCISVMGAVVVEYMLSGFKSSGISIFGIYIFPLCILAIVSIDYMLIYLRIIDNTCFNIGSLTTKIIIFLSHIYSTFTKANLYILEDTKNDTV